MANNDLQLEAEKLFPGDRRKQDAWIKLNSAKRASSTTKKPASTRKKKTSKTPAPAKRRRL